MKKVKKSSKKRNSKKQKYISYIYPSIIFGFMLSAFNYVFLILALYSSCYSGIYIRLFDSVFIDVIINTMFQVIFFGLCFFVVSYLFVEGVVCKRN